MRSVYTSLGVGHVLQGLWLQVAAGEVVPFRPNGADKMTSGLTYP
jgi:hypothetical protein